MTEARTVEILSIAVDVEQGRAVLGCDDGTVAIWDLRHDRPAHRARGDVDARHQVTREILQQHASIHGSTGGFVSIDVPVFSDHVVAVGFDEVGRPLAADAHRWIHRFDEVGRCLHHQRHPGVEPAGRHARPVALGGEQATVGLADGRVLRRDIASGDVRWESRPHDDQVLFVGPAADGWLSAGADGMVALLDARGRVLLRVEADGSRGAAVVDGQLLALSSDGPCRVFSAEDGGELAPILHGVDRPLRLAVCRATTRFAISGAGGELRIVQRGRGMVGRVQLEASASALRFDATGRLWVGDREGRVLTVDADGSKPCPRVQLSPIVASRSSPEEGRRPSPCGRLAVARSWDDVCARLLDIPPQGRIDEPVVRACLSRGTQAELVMLALWARGHMPAEWTADAHARVAAYLDRGIPCEEVCAFPLLRWSRGGRADREDDAVLRELADALPPLPLDRDRWLVWTREEERDDLAPFWCLLAGRRRGGELQLVQTTVTGDDPRADAFEDLVDEETVSLVVPHECFARAHASARTAWRK